VSLFQCLPPEIRFLMLVFDFGFCPVPIPVLPKAIQIAGHGLGGSVHSFVVDVADIGSAHHLIVENRLEIHVPVEAALIFDVLYHLLYIFSEHVDKRGRYVVAALLSLFMDDTLDSRLQVLVVSDEGVRSCAVYFFLALPPRKLLLQRVVVVHYAEMPQFEIDEGDVFHEGIPGDEAGEDGAYIREAVVLVETLLEADALLGLLKAEGLRRAS
jgi:hypothetical protein